MRVVALLIIIVFAFPSWGKPAIVKSGEHDDFSRLVLYTGKSQTWSVSELSDTVTISLRGWSEGFDVSSIFSTLRRDRILDVHVTPNSLVLTLGCDCVLDISALRQIGIMIDVKAKPRTNQLPRAFPLPRPPIEHLPTPRIIKEERAKSSAVTAFRLQLSDQLGRAATQGLLLPVPGVLSNPDNTSLTEEKPTPPPNRNRIRTTSATGRATRRLTTKPTQSVQCPSNNFGDIENWGRDQSFSLQLGELRRSITMEFDAIDQSKTVQLAQLYLHFAMGAEAILVLQTLSATNPHTDFLISLARIVDGSVSETSRYQLPTDGCTGSMAVWAALLDGEKSTISEAQSKLVGKAFGKLPHHLKVNLAAPLIARLRRDNNDVAASAIHNSMSNRLNLDAQSTDQMMALDNASADQLVILVSKNNELSAPAVIQIIRSNIDQGLPTEAPMYDVAMSYVTQQRGDPASDELRALLSKDAAVRGSYSLALTTSLEEHNATTRADLLTFVTKRVLEHGRDIEVAKFALRLGSKNAQLYLDKKTTNFLASRLRAAGLGELSDTFSKEGSTPQSTATGAIPPRPNEQQTLVFNEIPNLRTATKILDGSRQMRTQLEDVLGDLGQ